MRERAFEERPRLRPGGAAAGDATGPTRRETVGRIAVAAASLFLPASLVRASAVPRGANPTPPAPGTRSVPALVAVARREGILDSRGRYVPELLDDALAQAISRATGEETAIGGLRSLFSPSDRIGIKVNALAGRGLSPRPELVERLTGLLVEAGVPARQILVFDRDDRELKAAGFEIVRRGARPRCYGTGHDYAWTPREWGAGGSCFARVLGELTALINVGVLKDHDLAGLSAGMKNWYGVIHNPNKHHDDGCYPYVAHLAASEPIRRRLRLTLLDAATAQAQGGPALSAPWIWPFGGVLASRDPVALDSVALEILEARRAEIGLKSLAASGRHPRWLEEAARLSLGEARRKRIRRIDT